MGGQIIVSAETHERWPNLGRPECSYHKWPNRLLKSFEDEPHAVYEVLYYENQSPREPGIRFFPDFYKGERNRYIDRDAEEKKIFAQFSNKKLDGTTSRLVTIKAEGGMGKTRLAIACAVKMIGLFDGNAHFVNLAFTTPSKEAVAEAIGKAMMPPIEPATPETIFAALKARGDKRTLLILDNYESAKSREVGQYLSQLATKTRGIYLLVTGRTSVGVSDIEQIASLDDGMDEVEAKALFLARASLKNYTLTPSDEPHLSRILLLTSVDPHARAVQAIPLALELSAAWSGDDEEGLYTLKEIADGLEATPLGEFTSLPDDDFRADSASTKQRHDSLIRSLNWSFDLLGKKAGGGTAQQVFAACGLFVDTFDSDTVAQISGVPSAAQALRTLQNVSLIRRVPMDGVTRYSLHRFTRAYAQSKLADSPEYDATQERFLSYYRNLIETNSATGLHMNKPECRAILDKEWRNVLAAFNVAEQKGDYEALMLLASLWHFLVLRSWWGEWEVLENRILTAARKLNDRHREGLTRMNLGVVYRNQGRWVEAIEMYEQSLTIFQDLGDRHGQGSALGSLGTVYDCQGRWSKALEVCQRSLTIFQDLGDCHDQGNTLMVLCLAYQNLGRWTEAIEVCQQSLVIMHEMGDYHGQGIALMNLGNAYRNQGRWVEAIEMYEQSLTIKHEMDDRHGQGQTFSNLGIVYHVQGRWPEAIAVYEQSLNIFQELGDWHDQGITLMNLGRVYQDLGHWSEAIKFYSESLTISQELDDQHVEGQVLGSLGNIYQSQGRHAEAIECYKEGLFISQELNDRRGEGWNLGNLAMIYQSQGRHAEAIKFHNESLIISQELEDGYSEGLTLLGLSLHGK
ncbi:photosystem I assembly protein Ycf3 [Abditibacteriota bacterium]|nr:photosystem I assembly protein Ycf3 [Abditibacteriota bacterium]